MGSSARGSTAGGPGGYHPPSTPGSVSEQRALVSSNPNTPNTTTRELLAIRDMTRNHISSNDPSRRSIYMQSTGAILTHQTSDVSRLSNLSPSDVSGSGMEGVDVMRGVPGMVYPHAAASTTSLVYHEGGGVMGGYPGARGGGGNYAVIGQVSAGPRHRLGKKYVVLGMVPI